MITDKVLFQRAANGAAYMDEIEPGWWQKVDIAILDVSSCIDCVLGQMFGDYLQGLKSLGKRGGFDGVWERRCGFEPNGQCIFLTPGEYDRRVKVLNTAWIEEINRRKAAAAKPAGVLAEEVEPELVAQG